LHPENPDAAGRRDLWIAAGWAFAEATVFFIVPDVWLTRIALTDFRRALRACLVATLAAMLGGAAMFAFGRTDAPAAERVLDGIPGISPAMVGRVRGKLESDGPAAMLAGPLTGVPYKIYAVESGGLALDAGAFLAWSVAARLPRFALLCGGAALAARLLRGQRRLLSWLHVTLWIGFYTVYFLRAGR